MSVVLHADKNQEWARHGNCSPTMGQPGTKPKPSPPPKPTRSKSRQYESIEQYLVDKGMRFTLRIHTFFVNQPTEDSYFFVNQPTNLI